MNRRRFLASLATLPALAVAGQSLANGCRPHGYNTMACRAAIDLRHFQYAAQPQHRSQWCWAACISMVFAHHGFQVAQERIVREAYGAAVDMPAVAGWVIAHQLNRPWVDDRGRRFAAQLDAAYDADAGHMGINNDIILSELTSGRPLVMGAGSHAMVLTGLDYFATPMGLNITGGTVFDPWPGRGLRALHPSELFARHLGGSLRFLATVRAV
jgi:hypothetical protein